LKYKQTNKFLSQHNRKVNAKPLLTSPPNKNSIKTVTNTVPLVIIVLLKVVLMLLFITDKNVFVLIELIFSLILSKTITVSFDEKPISVRNAATMV